MKISESQLRAIIKQELKNSLKEAPMDPEKKAQMLAARRANAAREKERAAEWATRYAQEQEERARLQQIEDEAPPEKYRVKDPGSGKMRRYSLGLQDSYLRRLAAQAMEMYPKLMALSQQADPDFMDKFEQNLARISDSASWSGGSVPADEHIIRAMEAAQK